MITRTVTDTIPEYPNEEVSFYRRGGTFTLDEAFPPAVTTVTTDANGAYSAELWPNAEGLSATSYLAVYPGKDSFEFVLEEGDEPITAAELRVQEVWTWPSPTPAAIDAERARYANTSNPALGDALVGMRQVDAGASARTVHSKLGELLSVMDFGAVGDGTYSPLSATYATLAAAQAVYPHAVALTDSLDWAAIRAAGDALVERGGGVLVFPPGTYIIRSQSLANSYQGIPSISITDTSGTFHLVGFGATLKFDSAQYFGTSGTIGAFAVSGSCYPGRMLNFERNSGTIIVDGLELDGNQDTMVHTGGSKEITNDGILSRSNTGLIEIRNVHSHHHLRDGITITSNMYLRQEYPAWTAATEYNRNVSVKPTSTSSRYHFHATFAGATTMYGTSGASEPTWPTTLNATVVDGDITWVCDGLIADATPHLLTNVICDYNGRQALTIAGGIGITAVNSQFNHTGRATHYTAPAANIDIEPDTDVARHITFLNCQAVNARGYGLVAGNTRFRWDGVSRITDVDWFGGLLWGTNNSPLLADAPRMRIRDARIHGSIRALHRGVRTIWRATRATELGAFVIPTVKNGWRYRSLKGTGIERYQGANSTAMTGVAEPTWPTALGDTVVDGDITWVCDGVDFVPGDATMLHTCHIEDRDYPGYGCYRSFALVIAAAPTGGRTLGFGAHLRNCTVIANSNLKTLYLSGSTTAGLASLIGCTIIQLAPYVTTIGPNEAARVAFCYLQDTKFLETPSVGRGQENSTGSLTYGSTTIANVTNIAEWFEDDPIRAIGLPPGTSVVSVDAGAGTMEVSQAANSRSRIAHAESTGNLLSGDTLVTNVTNIADWSIGQTITGDGIQDDTTVAAVDLSGETLTLSQVATVSNSNVVLSHVASVGSWTSGSTTITNVTNISSWPVGSTIEGQGIPTGATITVNDAVSQLTISAATTESSSPASSNLYGTMFLTTNQSIVGDQVSVAGPALRWGTSLAGDTGTISPDNTTLQTYTKGVYVAAADSAGSGAGFMVDVNTSKRAGFMRYPGSQPAIVFDDDIALRVSYSTHASGSVDGADGVANSDLVDVATFSKTASLPRMRLHGHFLIPDGIAAPSTVAGFAEIYVDAADGKLKVRFGDGFTDILSNGGP